MNRISMCAAVVCVVSIGARGQAPVYTISTVAGGGTELPAGAVATTAMLAETGGAAVGADGNVYFSDAFDVVWKLSAGKLTVAAGMQNAIGYAGDGSQASGAQLNIPRGLAADASGNLYIADEDNGRIRKVDSGGTITTVAGGGAITVPKLGDGGPATVAHLSFPLGVTVDANGNLYIADTLNARIRKVSNGTITTVAGRGLVPGDLGDGGPATSAFLYSPSAVAVDAAGNLYIADTLNNRIRKVTTDGKIQTVAGSGSGSYSGDGGPATQAGLANPKGVAVDAAGNLYIADTDDNRVRLVTTDGTIYTLAGNGQEGFSGDGGPAAGAALNHPVGIAFDRSGNIYVANEGTLANRTARISVLTPAASASAPSIRAGGVVSAAAFGAFASIAPGTWLEIYGSNLAAQQQQWSAADFNGPNAPTVLGGTRVTIGGQPAFMSYVSPGQVNVQAPSNIAAGTQPIVVTTTAGASSAYSVEVDARRPGLLAPPSFIAGGKQYVVALFADGAYVLPPGAIAGVTSRRARAGDAILLFGIGFGTVVPDTPAGVEAQQGSALASPLHLSFGQTEATVAYDGLAPGFVGLYQVNVTVPAVAASDAVPVTFTLGGAAGTQTLYTVVGN